MDNIRLHIKHFKSVFDADFEIGNVNILIGANGSGKSALLEAIGVLSSAITDKVDDSNLLQRGVRLGTPALYKSSFKKQDLPLTIELGVQWKDSEGNWEYNVNLNNPIEKPQPSWEYFSERLVKNSIKIFGRSRATKYQIENFPPIELDKYRGLLSFLQGISDEQHSTKGAKSLYQLFRDYSIYMPNTSSLRGIQPDLTQKDPLGLFGGRLTEAVNDLLDLEEEMFGDLYLDEVATLLDWVQHIEIGKPNKNILSPSIPTTQKTIRFKDRFMREGRNELTPYDASEGSLYVLFVLTLAMHKTSPMLFAVDNFDQAMHPRLARAVIDLFSKMIIKNNRNVFLTTHNPLVLDGIDLHNEKIRLFAVGRNNKGHTTIKRVVVTDALLKYGSEGMSLSQLWNMGLLGGVPNI